MERFVYSGLSFPETKNQGEDAMRILAKTVLSGAAMGAAAMFAMSTPAAACSGEDWKACKGKPELLLEEESGDSNVTPIAAGQ